ncbi:MAG: endonuclease/exonuclease/phosphatase family protein [Planctomycetes bacterium]|nr:endonuclease/exonuclease/phosphatase family protein [Planctomycetota bacterium]
MRSPRLKILTWNILEGGMDGRLEGILKQIRSVRADVVALQECNGWNFRGSKLLRLAKRTLGMAGFPFWTTHGYQPVVLTKVPGAAAVEHDDQDHFHLGYQEIRLPLPGGRTWHFFNTHLNPFVESARVAEIKTLMRAMRPYRNGFCSLTGDLNSLAEGDTFCGIRMRRRTRVDLNRDRLVRILFDYVGLCGQDGYGDVTNPTAWLRVPVRIRRMQDRVELRAEVTSYLKRQGWTDLYRTFHPAEPGYTVPSRQPFARIDYAWLSPALARRAVSCEVLSGTRLSKLSDHFPLLWEVETGA